MSARYRLVGGTSLPQPKRQRTSAAIDSAFRHGTVRAAMSVSVSDRTIGRGSYRMTAKRSERDEHNAVNAKHNTAAWVCSGQRVPMRNISPGRNGGTQMTERTAVQ